MLAIARTGMTKHCATRTTYTARGARDGPPGVCWAPLDGSLPPSVYSWVDYTHYTHIIPAHITAYEPVGKWTQPQVGSLRLDTGFCPKKITKIKNHTHTPPLCTHMLLASPRIPARISSNSNSCPFARAFTVLLTRVITFKRRL